MKHATAHYTQMAELAAAHERIEELESALRRLLNAYHAEPATPGEYHEQYCAPIHAHNILNRDWEITP